jgi:hypothetical protein
MCQMDGAQQVFWRRMPRSVDLMIAVGIRFDDVRWESARVGPSKIIEWLWHVGNRIASGV